MTDDEEHLMSLGVDLARGIMDMIDQSRITEADCPDDWQWLVKRVREIDILGAKVKADDDID